MIPGANQLLSYLMAAPSISDSELEQLGVQVLERTTRARGLLIPASSLQEYRQLVRENLQPGFWNEVASPDEIVFAFKHRDGTLEEFRYPSADSPRISQLCASLNDDPIELTSDIPRYMASNAFYRDLMRAHYGLREG